MTTATQTVDIVAQVAEVEPRILNISDESKREMIAYMVYSGVPFDGAVAKFGAILDKSIVSAKEAQSKRAEIQSSTELEFRNAVETVIREAAMKVPEDTRPIGGWTIAVHYDREQKNADGSPEMDSENNPVRGYAFELHGAWKKKGESSGKRNSGSVAEGRGRRAGDFVVNGTSYTSMADFARTVGYDKDKDGASRAYLESKGYSIPNMPTQDEKGEWHTVLTQTANSAAG